jgi:hypothetical protein
MPDPVTYQTGIQTVAISHALSGPALIAAWENGVGESPAARALTLLRAGCPALDREDAVSLPVTLRDHALVTLRARSFGPRLAGTARCESCGERMEFSLQSQQIADSLHTADADCIITQDGVTLRLRLANTRDAMVAAAIGDLDAARLLLLSRCVEAVDADGQIVPLPDSLTNIALDRLEAMHERAAIVLTLVCPACDARQAVHFDIASFLWAEVRHAAQRLLDEVHELAWGYGWSEDVILAMSNARRDAYLERVRA